MNKNSEQHDAKHDVKNSVLTGNFVEQHYICPECGTEHFLSDLIMADNGWDYTYSCKNCGDIMESNGTFYW